MNIFYTDSDPVMAANSLAYVHVAKMPTEAAQMISTRIRLEYGSVEDFIYVFSRKKGKLRLIKKNNWYTLPCDKFIYRFGMKILVDKQIMAVTHKNHPSAVWMRDSAAHEEWVRRWARRMCQIFTQQTRRIHGAKSVLNAALYYPPTTPVKSFVEPPACVNDNLKYLAGEFGVEFTYQVYLDGKYREWQRRDKPVKVEFPCGEPYWYSKNWDTEYDI